ncbi:MAG: hemerythrin-like metal-binding protein [Candidatus Marinamargulisbacteria bacterium]|jgi:hemerythrin-like metal-binding protein
MVMKWSSNLSVGNEEIDNQHQELFQLVSMLDHAINTHNPTELESIISFLENYVVTHFAEEELLMTTNDYPEYDHHKSEHEKFKTFVSDLRADYTDQKSNTHVIFKIRQFIDKLVRHIVTVDIGIADIERNREKTS